MSDIEMKKWEFMASTPLEFKSTIAGQVAALEITGNKSTPRSRFRAYHMLRVAARNCPAAAYTLAGFLSDARDRIRPKRDSLYLALLEKTYKLGLARMRDTERPFEESRPEETLLRDVVSRAITNVGVDFTRRKDYVSALPYFRLASRIYPLNANAQLCLGRMCVFQNASTGADPIEGHLAWKKATECGPSCLNNEASCDCLGNLVAVVDQLRTRHGDEEARRYLVTRVAIRHEQSAGTAFKNVVASPEDVRASGLPPLSERAAAAAKFLETMAAAMGRSLPLETRVTVAASLLGRLAIIDQRKTADIKSIDRAFNRCEGFEPLHPFLGDHEWKDVSPPESLHLRERDTAMAVTAKVELCVECLRDAVPGISPEDAMIGLLFHIDPKFRYGVCSMTKSLFKDHWNPKVPTSTYNPAMNIQSPRG
jgi:hypothetical protein